MNIQADERVLEVGVGTGINLSLYPRDCAITGIDFSCSMLEKARERTARKELQNIRLLQMDAADLKFADNAFDIVYAPYLISVVPDPLKVAREMRRVCRPGGRIIFLNHFLSPNPLLSRTERLISPVHHPHRVQGGSRPAGVPRASRPAAGVDREGEHPAHLVARHVRQGLSRPFWLALVIGAFCLPLFIGLGRTDVENDEAIYSFAVDGIVATGDWLNPRSSPHDDVVFLEKPPLKFWIVAAPIGLGLLPHNEFGLRVLGRAVRRDRASCTCSRSDAGCRAGCAGSSPSWCCSSTARCCSSTALRGNNMEAPLFLCYCGGMYHFLAWGSRDEARAAPAAHRSPSRCISSSGFMTKFVAALFLPVVVLGAAALLVDAAAGAWPRISGRGSAAAGAVARARRCPGSSISTLRHGAVLWSIMFGTHVCRASRPRSTCPICTPGTTTD